MHMSRRRFALIGALLVTLLGGLSSASPARAERVEQPDLCAWVNGPTTSHTGCAYNASKLPVNVGFAAWVGGSTPALSGPVSVVSCPFLGGVAGGCIYTVSPTPTNKRVSINVPGSTAGVAGDISVAANVSVSGPEYCTWSIGHYGCSVDRGTSGRTVVYGWVGSQPTFSGVYTGQCVGLTPNGGQVCTSTSNANVVSASAPFESAGFIVVF